MNLRIKKLITAIAENNLDAFLVTKDVNIQYLTQRPSSDSWLFLCPPKAYYITDKRYSLEAKQNLRGITVKCYKRNISEPLVQLSERHKLRTIGFDARHMSYFTYNRLKEHLGPKIKLKPTNNLVENFRQFKDEEELMSIKKALKIHGSAIKFLKKIIVPGISEQEILNKLHKFVLSKNVDFSFDPIIASGRNSCYPHARVSSRKITKNDVILVDFGIDYKGYKSDLTRMFFLGKIPSLVHRINGFVKEAQVKAIERITPGIHASKVDQEARKYLRKKGLAKYFSHSLGHGVGLEVHENPSLSKTNDNVLKSSMVITVEPAVYLPNKFGIRIEDMILVTNKSCEVLSDDIN